MVQRMRTPVMPTGCPREIPEPLTPGGRNRSSSTSTRAHGKRLRGEGVVELDQVHVLERQGGVGCIQLLTERSAARRPRWRVSLISIARAVSSARAHRSRAPFRQCRQGCNAPTSKQCGIYCDEATGMSTFVVSAASQPRASVTARATDFTSRTVRNGLIPTDWRACNYFRIGVLILPAVWSRTTTPSRLASVRLHATVFRCRLSPPPECAASRP